MGIKPKDELTFDNWCQATFNKQQTLTKERMFAAYKLLDRDGDGRVDFDEIRHMFSLQGYTFSDENFKRFITEVDLDGDGVISYDEFEYMIQKMIDNQMVKDRKW